MARVSSRTLRHYDHVGLLPPARTGEGGLRFYEQPQLERLQHILLLRELGLGLPDIGRVLDGPDEGGTHETAALRRHHGRLLAESRRLAQLADTVAATIEHREKGTTMPAENLFTGFRDDPYAAEARERYGDDAVRSQERAASWDDGEAGRIKAEGDAVHRDLAALTGSPVTDPAVQAVVARQHAWVCHFWTPDAAAYTGLGRLYVDDERFTASIDATAPGLAAYLCAAIAVYARERLG